MRNRPSYRRYRLAIFVVLALCGMAGMAAVWPWPLHETHSDGISDTMNVLVAPPTPLANFIHLLQTGRTTTIVANVEGGHVWSGHQTLTHVSQFVNDPTVQDIDKNPLTPEYDRHATGVASVLGGHAAPQDADRIELHSGAVATKWNGKAYSGNFTTTPQAVSTAYGTFFGFADVINSSWGGQDPSGTSFAALITDGFANQHPHSTLVVSAGNAGPAPNTVGGPGSGYNNIAVGALQNNGTDVYDKVATFSSRGPQDYSDPVHGTVPSARAEVDLVAPGTHLTTAHYGGQTGGNQPSLPGSHGSAEPNAYRMDVKGTSFSAPVVASGIATLIDASKNDPYLADHPDARDARVLKSVVLNSVDKMPGWNNGQTPHPNGLGGVITTQALDWISGAGAFNLDQAYEQYLRSETRDIPGVGGGTIGKTGWDQGQVGIGQTNVYPIREVLPANTVLTVTVSWFRDRSFAPASMVAGESGHADLDLIIRDTATRQVVAESISPYNVVEHLSFTLPSRSSYQIEVIYTGNLFGRIRQTPYGLAWIAKAPTQQAHTVVRRCRWSAPRPLSAGENPSALCFTTHRPIRSGSTLLPRGGWLVAK